MVRAAVLLLTFSLATGPASSQAPAPMTSSELRALAPETLTRRIFGDLSQIMFPLSEFAPGGIVERLQFLSRARAGQTAGMCETDGITLFFESRGSPTDADPPIVPSRVATSPFYFVRDLARLRRREPSTPSERGDPGSACATADPRDYPLIAGRGEPSTAVLLVADLLDSARAGGAPAPLDCTALQVDGQPSTRDSCLRELAAMDVGDIEREESCGFGPGNWDSCMKVIMRPLEVEFDLRDRGSVLSMIRVFPARSERINLFRRPSRPNRRH